VCEPCALAVVNAAEDRATEAVAALEEAQEAAATAATAAECRRAALEAQVAALDPQS